MSNAERIRRIKEVQVKKAKLKSSTGHELLLPSNQYCMHCGEAMYVTELANAECKGNPEFNKTGIEVSND